MKQFLQGHVEQRISLYHRGHLPLGEIVTPLTPTSLMEALFKTTGEGVLKVQRVS